MARLRGPGGCAWDREQTHASLAPYVLEEAHEVLEAIGHGDQQALRAELGDLLLQVVFHGQMAHEAGGFTARDVVDGLVRKLLDRHPHVFGERRAGVASGVRAGTPAEVLAQWHELKRREAPERGAFDGIPSSLPALARAQKLLRRTAVKRAGSPVPLEIAGVAEAAGARADELADALSAGRAGAARAALGALLFAAAALAETGDLDAESALREACEGFVEQQKPAG